MEIIVEEYLTSLSYKAEIKDLEKVDAIAAERSKASGIKMERADLIHAAIAKIKESPERLTAYIQKLLQENVNG